MKMFDEIEAKHGTTPVISADGTFDGGGTLILAGRKSEAVLQCSETLRSEANSDGWFDLHLRAPNGRPILLHNALLTQSIQHGFASSRNYEEHVYPNTVILGSDALVDGRVAKISFTLKELDLFFHYQHVEHHSLFDAPADLLASLKALRRKGRGYDRFKPRELYVAHTFPRTINFRVGSAKYEVYVGFTKTGFERHAIDYRTLPIASISFDSPVSIDAALDAAWQWKQFFSTLVLRPLPWTSLTASAGRRRPVREADFYIPNHADDRREERGPFSVWPGNVPLNRWRERGELGRVMAKWLSKQPQRQRLRGAIENVSRDIGQRVSIDDIVTLCAGIESLEELTAPSSLTKAEVALLGEGAVAAALQHGIDVDPSRIRGVLDLLQHQSLPQRLRRMFEELKPLISDDQARLLISSVRELRTVAAHGDSPSTTITPKAAPTIEGLACACALYDLVTCGMPTKTASDQRIGILSHLHATIFELETIKALAKSKPKPATNRVTTTGKDL